MAVYDSSHKRLRRQTPDRGPVLNTPGGSMSIGPDTPINEISEDSIGSGRDYRTDAALRPQPRRRGADSWGTPISLINALVVHVLPSLPCGIIWECAAGDGRLADAMRNVGRQVVASDFHGNGIDFLHDDPPSPGQFGAIVTNPPFNSLDAFIARGLHLIDIGKTLALVLLLRNDALMTSGRVDVLNRAALTLGCNWRARWIPDSTGQPRWGFTWVVWRYDQNGPPRAPRVQHRLQDACATRPKTNGHAHLSGALPLAHSFVDASKDDGRAPRVMTW
jgi:hypothetical protein